MTREHHEHTLANLGPKPKPASKPILCVDFDGVLHSYTSGWQGAGTVSDPPVPGAMDFLVRAVGAFDVQIYSSRSKEPAGLKAMEDAIARWLASYFDAEPPYAYEWVGSNLKFPTQKPAAFLTLDDRCICFNGTFPDLVEMRDFTPWNKR